MPRHPDVASRVRAVKALRDHPALPELIPSLPPTALARLYDTVGLHDAGSLMAAAPPALLARALDEAVWATERFDADVFVDWLEVWLHEGEAFAVERLLALDEDLLALCFASVLEVTDSSVDGIHRWAHDDGADTEIREGQLQPGVCSVILDRFVVTAAHDDEWDLVEPALLALWDHVPDVLLDLLGRLTADDSRLDGEDRRPGFEHDMAGARDRRRERAGYVPPAAARAFLAQVRVHSRAALIDMNGYDPESARHLGQLGGGEPRTADHRASPPPGAGGEPAGNVAAADRDPAPSNADVWSLLDAAGVIGGAPAAGLLTGPGSGPALPLEAALDDLGATDPDGLARAAAELAYLANVLVAAVDLPGPERGHQEQGRALAFATANLGLELLDGADAALPGVPPGLIRTFLIAWQTLDGLPARLVRVCETAFLSPAVERRLQPRPWLRVQLEESLDDLRAAVRERDFDQAREALGLLSLALDTDACRAAALLLGEPPRFPGLLEGGDQDQARWIRTRGDLERVGQLLRGLVPG